MSTEANSGRQYPLVAVAELAFSDLPTGVATPVFELPQGAVVVGGDFVVTQASDAATSEAIDIGDADDPDRYSATPVDGKVAARTALDVTGFKTSGQSTIDVTRTETGVATQGQYRIAVHYYIVGRSNENQG